MACTSRETSLGTVLLLVKVSWGDLLSIFCQAGAVHTVSPYHRHKRTYCSNLHNLNPRLFGSATSPLAPHLIIPQDTLHQHLGTNSTVFGTSVLFRVMTDSFPTRHKYHTCRTPTAGIDTVMPRTTDHIPSQVPASQHRFGRLPYSINTFRMKIDRRRRAIRAPLDSQPLTGRERRPSIHTLALRKCRKISLQLLLDQFDSPISRSTNIEAESHITRDSIHASRG